MSKLSTLTYEEKIIALCEIIEKRFNEKAKKTDMVKEVGEKISNYLKARHHVPKSLYGISYTGTIHITLFKISAVSLFILGWLANEDLRKSVIEKTENPDENLLKRKLYKIASRISQLYTDHILNLLDYSRVIASSPIAQRIYLAYLSRYSSRDKRAWTPITTPYVYQGARLILTGTLGCGKTTMAFTSLYSFFRLLDFTDEEAKKLTLLFFVNNLNEAVKLLIATDKVAEEGLMVPAVVIDDVGAILPKYAIVPWASDKQTAKLSVLFTEYFQISREGIGCKVVVSAPNMTLKGIRETADSVIEGISIRDSKVYTIWFEFMKFYKPIVRQIRGEIPSLIKSRILLNITGTIHPPLVIPKDVNEELTKRKLETRRKLLTDMLTILEGKSGEEEETNQTSP